MKSKNNDHNSILTTFLNLTRRSLFFYKKVDIDRKENEGASHGTTENS